jgi:hypothetical protein
MTQTLYAHMNKIKIKNKQTKMGRENWIFTCARLKLDPCLLPCTNINSEFIKDLNLRSETVKLLQERKRKTLEHIGLGKIILHETRIAHQIREMIDKWDCNKLKIFCTAKETIMTLNT